MTHQTVHANMASHLIIMDIVGQLVRQMLLRLAGKIPCGTYVRVHGASPLTLLDIVRKLVINNNNMVICLFVLVIGESISMALVIVCKSVSLENKMI